MIFCGENFNFELGKKTYIMGILNVTGDSFYDGGMYNTPQKAVKHTKQMIVDGADIIDIGAQSTRPDSSVVSEEDELEIIKKYLPLIYNETGAVISIDTFYPSVAEYALNNGAAIVNDVSGMVSDEMANVIKKYNAGWIIMHTGGGNAGEIPCYVNGVVEDVNSFFEYAVDKCTALGINLNNIMLDIGVGFGKSYEQNLEVIRNINQLKREGIALLTALSSKRVVGIATNTENSERLYGTLAGNTLAIVGGTDFLRVHNVKESVLAAKMADAVVRNDG